MTDANSTEGRKKLLEWGHDYLLKIAQARFPGFKDDGGMCEGINSVLGHAVLLGKEAEQHFYDRLEFLRQYALDGNTPEQLVTAINEIYQPNMISPEILKTIEKENADEFDTKIEDAKNRKDLKEQQRLEKAKKDDLEARKKAIREANQAAISEEKKALQAKLVEFEVDAFFNTIVRAHNTPGIGLIDQRTLQFDKKWEHLTPFAFDDETGTSKYIHSTVIGTMVANSQELIDYFVELEYTLREKTKKSPQGERPFFLLSSDDHTASVYFDIPTGKLCYFDVNNLRKNKENKYFLAVSEGSEGLIASNVIKGFQDFDKGFEKSQTIFTIRRLSTQGYDLALMEDLGASLELDKKTNQKLPPKGKIYLSEKGEYLFRDMNDKIHKGVLTLKPEINLHNLKAKFFDVDFKKAILESISRDTGVTLIDDLDKTLQTQASKSLYKKSLNPFSKNYKDAKNARGFNLLHVAISSGQITLANDLITQKYKINEPNSKGITPLMLAAQFGHVDLVNALIKQGANIHAKTNGGATALGFAAKYGHIDVMNTLISHGANINGTAETEISNSPLMLASEQGDLKVVEFLLQNKANPTLVDSAALSLAFGKNHISVIKVLTMKMISDAKTEPEKNEIRNKVYNIALAQSNLEIIQFIFENIDKNNKPSLINRSLETIIAVGSVEFLEKFIDSMLQKHEKSFNLDMVQEQLESAFLLPEEKKRRIVDLLETKRNINLVMPLLEKQKTVTIHFDDKSKSTAPFTSTSSQTPVPISQSSSKKKPG